MTHQATWPTWGAIALRILVMALPAAIWAAWAWRQRTISLRSIFVLIAIEAIVCVLALSRAAW